MAPQFSRSSFQASRRRGGRLDPLARDPSVPVSAMYGGTTGHGRNAQDDRWWLRYLSALPDDARAVIEPLPIATNQSGRARKDQWRLRFQQRKKPFVDWLMGWTGGEDPLPHIDLRFPTREAAERYCERLNLPYDVHEPSRAHFQPINKQRFQLDDSPIKGWPGGTAA